MVKVRTSVGSKDVRGVNGIRPRCQVRVLTLADWRSLGVRAVRTRELVRSCAKGDLSCLHEVCLGEC